MEDNKNVVETETTNVEETETTVAEKTFTQKEFDEALQKAVARKTKNVPSDEELKSYNEWKESKKTESEKNAEREREYQKSLTEKEELKRENLAFKKGISADEVEFVVFKVSKMEGDFEENLEAYLENNPKFTEKKENAKATGTQTNNSSVEKENGVNSILRAKHPELFN